MSLDLEAIYRLLPAYVRVRDAEQGQPLKALLAIVAEQVAVLQDDLDQLYDDQFIETCAEWVVPYIGDLVGAGRMRPFKGAHFSQRALVADTIAARRGKGTVSALQRLAGDATQWEATVVEYFQRLATTQHMKHLRPSNLVMPSLRQGAALEDVGTPFDETARTFEARRIAVRRGRYNISNVGIFLWRLDAHRLSQVPPFAVGGQRFVFDPLGREAPLFGRVEDDARRVARPITLRRLEEDLARFAADPEADPVCYGPGRSIELQVDGVAVPASQVRSCDLSDVGYGEWAQAPGTGYVIDPARGRLLAPAGLPAGARLRVSFHYGFPRKADLGGGEYARGRTFSAGLPPPVGVTAPDTIQAALDGLTGEGAVEVRDNETYAEALAVQAPAGQEVELRARDGCRPIVRAAEVMVTGGEGAKVTLNGFVFDGRLRVPAAGNRLESLRLRHCTLAPGTLAALVVELPDCEVAIESCLVGGIQAVEDALVSVSNSIVDAGAEDAEALSGADANEAGPVLRVRESTLIGRVRARVLKSASNSIFLARPPTDDPLAAPVQVERLQEGGVRFSYVPPGSRVPRRYKCRPGTEAGDDRVRPVLASHRYGDPGYGQLSVRCPAVIREGAHDGAEMGAFHDLFQPQRVGNLGARLEEHLRFGLEAGIFFAS